MAEAPSFIVTKKAMRPASPLERCFYCHQPIGSTHKPDCVVVSKMVKVRMIVDYKVRVPYHWDKRMIEFHRNDGTWCSTNALQELTKLDEEQGCLCRNTTYECTNENGEAFLAE